MVLWNYDVDPAVHGSQSSCLYLLCAWIMMCTAFCAFFLLVMTKVNIFCTLQQIWLNKNGEAIALCVVQNGEEMTLGTVKFMQDFSQ